MIEKVLPIPCTDVKPKTLREWFALIDDKLNSFKEALIEKNVIGLDTPLDSFIDTGGILVENVAAELITEITSMLEAIEIDEKRRQEAQKRVNEKNREKSRAREGLKMFRDAPPTEKQLDFIHSIEEYGAPEFTGTTKKEASIGNFK